MKNKTEDEMLDYIVAKRGDCLDLDYCNNCPFIALCAKSMMRSYKNPPMNVRAQRVNKALELITDRLLMGTELSIDNTAVGES